MRECSTLASRSCICASCLHPLATHVKQSSFNWLAICRAKAESAKSSLVKRVRREMLRSDGSKYGRSRDSSPYDSVVSCSKAQRCMFKFRCSCVMCLCPQTCSSNPFMLCVLATSCHTTVCAIRCFSCNMVSEVCRVFHLGLHILCSSFNVCVCRSVWFSTESS